MSLDSQTNRDAESSRGSENAIASQVDVLRNAYSNVKVFTVVPMGILMIIYFFTFATLIDRGMFGVLAFEIVTTVFFIVAIININRWPFSIVKWRYAGKPAYREILPYMSYQDFDKSTDDIVNALRQRKQDSVVT